MRHLPLYLTLLLSLPLFAWAARDVGDVFQHLSIFRRKQGSGGGQGDAECMEFDAKGNSTAVGVCFVLVKNTLECSHGNGGQGHDDQDNDGQGDDSQGDDSQGDDSQGNDGQGNDGQGNDGQGGNGHRKGKGIDERNRISLPRSLGQVKACICNSTHDFWEELAKCEKCHRKKAGKDWENWGASSFISSLSSAYCQANQTANFEDFSTSYVATAAATTTGQAASTVAPTQTSSSTSSPSALFNSGAGLKRISGLVGGGAFVAVLLI